MVFETLLLSFVHLRPGTAKTDDYFPSNHLLMSHLIFQMYIAFF